MNKSEIAGSIEQGAMSKQQSEIKRL